MNIRGARLALLVATMISLTLSFAVRGFAAGEGEEVESVAEPEFGIDWDYRPADLDDLTTESPLIVVAQVEAVRSGDPLVAPPADGEGEPFTAPTQRIDLRVTETLEGEAPEQLTLFKLGEPGYEPTGDPAYAAGERYLLFVRRRMADDGSALNPDGTYIAVAPDGRLEKTGDGLEPLIEGPVAQELEGLSVNQAEAAISETGEGP